MGGEKRGVRKVSLSGKKKVRVGEISCYIASIASSGKKEKNPKRLEAD